NVQVSQEELTQYLIQGASQYGMEPGEFIKVLDENGQIPQMVGEVARNKAIAVVLGKATVVEPAGADDDLTDFLPPADDETTTEDGGDSESDAAPEGAAADGDAK